MSDTETVESEDIVEESTMEEDLGPIFDEINAREDGPERDEQGRFKAKETEEQEVSDVQPDAEIGATEEVEAEEVEPLEVPTTLSATAQAAWPSLPREFQEEILRREGERTQIESERATLQPIEAAIEPLRQHLQLNGVEPGQYIAQLVAADQYLKTNPQEAMRWIANQYGYDLNQLAETQQDVDPALAPFVNEINELKTQISGFATQQQQAEAQRVQSEIDAFAKDHPHFEEVRQHMGALMNAGAAPDMAKAYEMAVWANPSTRAKMQADQSAAEAEKRKEETEAKAAKAKTVAAGNLSNNGTAGGATPPQFKTREDELASIYDNVQGA